ncbi:MAG: glycosylasparaginase, partial [Saprospiraceae bacterium]|nr:glycosylasparaginase [Saprospiraceae bacterium]
MGSRRKFIRNTGLGLAGLSMPLDGFGDIHSQGYKKIRPLVLSTWDFGMEANQIAWKVLKKGGSALDAVEQGVRLTESDPENASVGVGGLPDRNGKITLD